MCDAAYAFSRKNTQQVLLKISLLMPMSIAAFDTNAQQLLKTALAAAAGVAPLSLTTHFTYRVVYLLS